MQERRFDLYFWNLFLRLIFKMAKDLDTLQTKNVI